MNEVDIAIGPDTDKVAFILRNLPDGDFLNIILKPNWVRHEERTEFPITALVTSAELIDATIQACLKKYPGAKKITVGDVPLQTCDWPALLRQTGIDKLISKYSKSTSPRITFLDLRKERWRPNNGFMEQDSTHLGDPLGYSEVVIDHQSLLEEVSHNADRFRVSDYDPTETVSVHRKGVHRYLIARTILEADLFINLPKMKTHQKTGVTGALKNLVGINGSKAHLVHHQLGFPKNGGDEFSDDTSRLIYWQVRLRERFQKKSKIIFKTLKRGWEIVKKLRGIKTVGTKENLANPGAHFYVGAGSWHGNDSVWRMVFDLNMIILFAHADGGPLRKETQRRVVTFMDGVVAGEGNGPLQPLPVQVDALLASENPFLVDLAMSKLMGFDFKKVRLLSNFKRFPHTPFTAFEPMSFAVKLNGKSFSTGLDAIPILHRFIPSPGWKGHCELP